MTGHGGDEFLKFQDSEEISSNDIADAFAQMYEVGRYNEILFIIDTCQANTLFNKFYSPNIVSVGSSALGENSYSHHSDSNIGVAVIDRLTYYMLDFFERQKYALDIPLLSMFKSLTRQKLRSTVGWSSSLSRNLTDVPISDFFSSVLQTKIRKSYMPHENVDGDVPSQHNQAESEFVWPDSWS